MSFGGDAELAPRGWTYIVLTRWFIASALFLTWFFGAFTYGLIRDAQGASDGGLETAVSALVADAFARDGHPATAVTCGPHLSADDAQAGDAHSFECEVELASGGRSTITVQDTAHLADGAHFADHDLTFDLPSGAAGHAVVAGR